MNLKKHYLFEEYNINSIYIYIYVNNIFEAVMFFQHIEDNLWLWILSRGLNAAG